MTTPTQTPKTTQPLKISPAGIDLIKHFEGLSLTAYRCPAGVLTIGYGHTATVTPGQTITEAEAEQLLRGDLAVYERCVADMVRQRITQAQFDALVSFAFNLGCGAISRSTLMRKLNAEDVDGAANEFPRWVHANGQRLAGLERRRAAERDLFLS